jgi:hypothetical protein
MLYQRLYNYIQALPIHIKRDLIRDKVLEIAQVPRSDFKFIATTLDARICRGIYIAPGSNNPLAIKPNVVAVARGLNRCWTRFVYIKELMHLLDGPTSATDTGDLFEQVLAQLTSPSILSPTLQTKAELEAFWKALGVICPEEIRLRFKQDRMNGHISDYDIALQLRIPALYVPKLFSTAYEQIIVNRSP